MAKITLDDIHKLFDEIIMPFYQVKRDMPLQFRNENENDAEHSWGLALMAVALAPKIDPKLDVGKVSILAIVHDLVEIHAGDTSVWADDSLHKTKKDREQKALKRFEKDHPEFSNLFNYIKEYDQKQTREAKFIYALDKFFNFLTMEQNLRDFYKTRKITKQEFEEKLVIHRQKGHSHAGVAPYYDELLLVYKQNPEYFYKD